MYAHYHMHALHGICLLGTSELEVLGSHVARVMGSDVLALDLLLLIRMSSYTLQDSGHNHVHTHFVSKLLCRNRNAHQLKHRVLCLQIASVMGLMSVALRLLLFIHPISVVQDDSKESTSSRQDLRNDMQDLENAGFLKACKGIPDSWDFAQVCYAALQNAVHCIVGAKSTYRIASNVLCFAVTTTLQGRPRLLACCPGVLCRAVL